MVVERKVFFTFKKDSYWISRVHLGHFLDPAVVQSLSHVWLFATPWTAACQTSLSFTISQSLFKLMSIESMMPSNHLILCCPLLLLPSICYAMLSHFSRVQLFVMPWTAAHQAPSSFTISQSLLKFVSIESVMLSNHLILCHPLFLLPSVFPSMGVFFNELTLCIRWPKNWSFSISPSSEYSGLISFRIDWFDLLAIHEALKSLCQHYNSKASILQHSAFFMVQLSHPYMTMT